MALHFRRRPDLKPLPPVPTWETARPPDNLHAVLVLWDPDGEAVRLVPSHAIADADRLHAMLLGAARASYQEDGGDSHSLALDLAAATFRDARRLVALRAAEKIAVDDGPG
jgi:hypothetical protein